MLEPDVISSDNRPGTPFQERFDYIGPEPRAQRPKPHPPHPTPMKVAGELRKPNPHHPPIRYF